MTLENNMLALAPKKKFYRDPDPTKVYILVHDDTDSDGNILVSQGSLVTNVHFLPSRGMLEFTVVATGKTYTTWYGWMFAESTSENIKQLEKMLAARERYFQAKRELRIESKRLKTIDGGSEGNFDGRKI